MVSIVIVNYNTKELTKNCLSSVYAKTKDVDFDVFLVDNGSKDGSVEYLRAAFPEVKFIVNEDNPGFGKANNMAARASMADYVFFLNPDTLLVNNAVKIFLEFMERKENEKVACCGGSLYDEQMTPQIAYGNFPSLEEALFKVFRLKKIFPKYYKERLRATSENKGDSIRKVDYIVGADMFVRKKVLDKIGLFDEDFFLYFEDTELNFRMQKNGYSSVIVPEAKIIHLAAKSSSGASRIAKIKLREKSRFMFFRKCYGERTTLLIKTLYLAKELERVLLKGDKESREMLKIIRQASVGAHMSHDTPNLDLSIKDQNYYHYERKEMLEFIPEGTRRALDVGCGAGSFGYELKRTRGAEVWGIEIDEKSAALATDKLDRVLAGDVTGLIGSLPDSHFDCIVFNDVLEHLVDPYSVLLRIKPKLTPGGVIVSSLPNIRYYKILKELVVHKQWKYADAGILDKTHLRFFTKASIIDMFEMLDFRILTLKGLNKARSRNFRLLNMILLGFLDDAQYSQFACVVAPKAKGNVE